MKTDIEIAQEIIKKPIQEIASKIGLKDDDLELYGKYKAKISEEVFEKVKDNPDGKLVLVTAIHPTPAGEGKTTTTVGLGQALNQLGKNCIIALREPSLGPCMGIKGGATGGGYSQVVPMEEINLHFTGDIHAITAAHNLLSAMIDNHLYQKNELNLDQNQIVWKRVLDMNDRSLRNIVIGLGGKTNGIPREDGFIITVASEIMAILCLAEDINDLKQRLGKIIVGYTYDNKPITANDLNANGAMSALLKDAIKPNIVQTLEHTPAIIHGGPFANIAHGCNSVRATKLALKLSDIVVTEAGFGADLGAEKFLDIKCRIAGLKPDAVVLVATIRALKYSGGVQKSDLNIENNYALKRGIANLLKHIENIRKFKLPVIVALNIFSTDIKKEIDFVKRVVESEHCKFAISTVWENGGKGGIELAQKLLELINNQSSRFEFLYNENDSIKEKVEKIAQQIYGAKGVVFTPNALKQMQKIQELNLDNLPVCIAKTPYSFSDDPNLIGRPENFEITVKELRLSAGAGFIVVITGDIMIMPGLPKVPAATNIDINEQGNIIGLF